MITTARHFVSRWGLVLFNSGEGVAHLFFASLALWYALSNAVLDVRVLGITAENYFFGLGSLWTAYRLHQANQVRAEFTMDPSFIEELKNRVRPELEEEVRRQVLVKMGRSPALYAKLLLDKLGDDVDTPSDVLQARALLRDHLGL